MKYTHPDGYVHCYTADTVNTINNRNRGPGRIKLRYNICLRDGNLTPVHTDLTPRQLSEIKAEIERQGNQLY